MPARTLMVQGTASSAGKSLLVTALCRIFRQRGLRVAPFKSQNMSLNSAVTPDGREIGRAQAVQAEAAGIDPSVQMNPILIKPEGNSRSQVVVLGKPVARLSVNEYHDYKPELRRIIVESLEHLRASYDIVVIEGAGSPAEINLKEHDLANMFVATAADAPVLLAGDIDRGGVFAALLGTIELLDPDERARVAAFIVNKFRGERRLLEPGLHALTQRTNIPVLGVVPFIEDLRIADEDSVALEDKAQSRPQSEQLNIAVIRFPAISNFDDFDPLAHEPGVAVRYVAKPHDCIGADLLILPGTKSTVADLEWLRASGFAQVIADRVRQRGPVLGICGGCQMLGVSIEDPLAIESTVPHAAGLNLLKLTTRFEQQKTTTRVKARVAAKSFLSDTEPNAPIDGYEIHMGSLSAVGNSQCPFEITERNGQAVHVVDGALSDDGTVVGTMLHGIFENDSIRGHLLNHLRQNRSLPGVPFKPLRSRQDEYDRLAAAVRENIDMDMLLRIARV